MSKDLKKLSKGGFTVDTNSLEAFSTSCLMRIADATELMASNYLKLQNDLDFYSKRCKEHRQIIESKNRTIASLKGHITRLKNKEVKQ